ncbi:MAG: hypothetical protein KAS71_10775 [Bacteroidales bacterium]|nr:hypothetical protein [Bacteroidales bacterium]
MKNFSIIIAMLFLAFTVEAQNDESTKRTPVKKSTNTSVRKTTTKKAPAKVAKPSSNSRSSATKPSGSSSARSSTSKKSSSFTPPKRTTPTTTSSSSSSATPATRTSPTKATRSTESRSSSSTTPPTRTTTTRTTGDDANRSGSSRTVNSQSSNTRERSTGTSTVDAQRSRNSQSTRGEVYTPRTAVRDAETRKVYTTHTTHRVKRKAPTVHYTQQTLDYRRTHHPYIVPRVTAIYWNSNMYYNYRLWYPDFNLWYYPYGYRIHTISAYDAYSYIGEIARIYGRVTEVWYARETREYYLYIGGSFPHHDFTIILESNDARRFSSNPVRYFTNRQLTVTGLVSLFEGKPEVFVKRRSQISMY